MNLIPSFISCRKAAKSNIYNKQLDVCLDPKNVVNTLFSYVEDGTTREIQMVNHEDKERSKKKKKRQKKHFLE